MLFSGVISVQVVAAIGRTEQAAGRRRVRAVATGTECPAFAAEIPHARRGARSDWPDPSRSIEQPVERLRAFQDQVPRLAAIGRLVETAIRRIAPQRARHGRVNRVAVLRTHDDLRDPLGVRQTRHASRFRRHPWIDKRRCRSKRCCASTIRQCRPRRSSNFSDRARWRRSIAPAARRTPAGNVVPPSSDFQTPPLAAPTKIVILPIGSLVRGDGGNAAAHRGRADVARAEAGDGGGVIGSLLRDRESEQTPNESRRCESER